MTTLALQQPPARGRGLGEFLRQEMTPFPGRMDAVWRFVICSAIIVVCSMTLQVPFLGFSLITMLFTAQDNTVFTKLSGVVEIIGVTLAVALSILLLKATMGYPMWRVLGACLIVFCGMYFMRISKLGPIGFVVAMLVIYAQSLADIIDQPEALTRALLWTWVAAAYPVVVTVVVNELFRPAQPVRLLTDEMTRQLDAVSRQLEARLAGTVTRAPSVDAVERGVLQLHRYLAFATLGDAAYGREQGRHLMRIASMDRLHTAAAHLAQWPAEPLTPAHRERLEQVQACCAALRLSLQSATTFGQPPNLREAAADEDALMRILREMSHALHAFADADAAPPPDTPAPKEPPLASDAFDNPNYGRFALKTVLAAMLCYVFYTAVNWPGIHTAMLTCVILALPSLGATSHKGLNRVIGCAVGSLISLAATVFVIPHLDGIVGLLGLTLPVIALGAWIAAGSARTNYVGVQIVFAFALALLGHLGPTTDLTEIRDRMLGILLGVAVSVTVSTLVWPERDGDNLRTMLGRLLRSIAGLARAATDRSEEPAAHGALHEARMRGWSLLSQNRELQARVALEPGWQYAHDSVTTDLTSWLARAQRTLVAVDYLQLQMRHAAPHLTPQISSGLNRYCTLMAERLERLADHMDTDDAVGNDLPEPMSALAWPSQDAMTKTMSELRAAAQAVDESVLQLRETQRWVHSTRRST